MARNKMRKQRLNETGSEDVATVVFLLLGVICLVLGIVMQMIFMCVIGVILVLCGVAFLLYIIHYRVWWDLEAITVQTLFRKSHVYPYAEISHYYTTINQTVLVLKSGRKIKLKDSHTDLLEMERALKHMKKHLIFEHESEKQECPLYWGNCSRPVQLTLFLLLLGIGAFFSGCLAWAAAMPVQEEDLTYGIIRVVATDIDPDAEDFLLYSADGTVYYISTDLNKLIKDADSWVGEEFTIGYDEAINTIYTLKYRFETEPVFDLEEYNAATLKANLFLVVLFGFFPLFYLVFLIFIILAYRFPDTFLRLYEALETMHFWGRHW